MGRAAVLVGSFVRAAVPSGTRADTQRTLPVSVLAPAAVAGRLPRPQPSRIAELDGVRAIAIWLVLAIHILLRDADPHAGDGLHGLARAGYLLLSHMWLGVDLFFVLSGFLITGILLDTKARRTYFREFYARRAIRILPLVLLLLLAIAVAVPGSRAWVMLSVFFLADIAPLAHVHAFAGAPPLWSLAVEEQFYLVWPLLVLCCNRGVLAAVAGLIAILEPVARTLFPNIPFEVAWFRWDGLAIGALAALWVRSEHGRPADTRRLLLAASGVAMTAVLAEVAAHSGALSGALRITEADLVFGAAVIAAVVWSGAPALAPLRSPACRFAARTSFCAYLLHVPIIEFVDRTMIASWLSPVAAAVVRAALVLPATLLVAALSWRYFEAPLLRRKRAAAS